MTIKEIAHAFDMTVCELAKYIGYTRQALYSGDVGNTVRSRAAVRHLDSLSRSMLQEEHRAAVLRFDARTEAVAALREMLMDEEG